MSWSSLKSTFSQVKGVKSASSLKRKLYNKPYSKAINFPVCKTKRPRLCAPLSENRPPESGDSDESLDYDPDYDDYCNGCLNRTFSEILPILTKSPDSKTVTRSPFRERNSIHDFQGRSQRLASIKDRRVQRRNPNWKPLESTFRETCEERSILEKSITTGDSDENENEENSPSPIIIQSQSSDGRSSQEFRNAPREAPVHQQTRAYPDSSKSNASNYSSDLITMQFSKKIQCRKGGYVEKVRRALNRHKSDYAFWYHAQRSGFNTDGIQARVKDITNMYGRRMMKIADSVGEEILVSVDDNEKLRVGSEIKIQLDPHCHTINNLRCYLGFNKIKKL